MFYVNGASTTISGATLYTPLTPTAFAIGSGGPSDRFFQGAINDVRIYNIALSESEIQQLYYYEATACTNNSGATATATVSDGFVISATVTDPGCGYTNSPSIQIVGGGGTGAAATVVVTNGEVVQIIITDAGIGYTNTPSIYVNSPIGAQIALVQALVPAFSNLSVGLNYQLQSSTDLVTWMNQGPAFVATNATMYSPQYFNVPNTNQLYFRLQGAP